MKATLLSAGTAAGNKSEAERFGREQCSPRQLEAGDSIFSSIPLGAFKAVATQPPPNPIVQQRRHPAQMAPACETNGSDNGSSGRQQQESVRRQGPCSHKPPCDGHRHLPLPRSSTEECAGAREGWKRKEACPKEKLMYQKELN